ncbi:DUF5367 family protein [Stappia sp. ES.058]|uniref:DUF5367 family protein n=1 Tax=Stappia sp. ES.058 TaxID=1881061 RepID=UPI00087BDEFA|nr:DUF5367 family protein [Stappia sp. ES.058]SDU06066.1 hypothetical protein SAMN05428979_1399 [Stappia sp. ES.058]
MRRGLFVGIVGWIAASLLFRLFGHLILVGPGLAYVVALVVGGVAAGAISLLAAWLICEPGKSARFAAGVVIPGLLGDAAATLAFARVFPAIPSEYDVLFAAMMLWGYGVILAVLILFGEKVVKS